MIRLVAGAIRVVELAHPLLLLGTIPGASAAIRCAQPHRHRLAHREAAAAAPRVIL